MKLKRKQGGYLAVLFLATSVVQPVISSLVKAITGKGVNRAGREYCNNMVENF